MIRLSLDDMFTRTGDLLIDIEQSVLALLMSRKESDGENSWDKIVSQTVREVGNMIFLT